jgi:hypothetical protein
VYLQQFVRKKDGKVPFYRHIVNDHFPNDGSDMKYSHGGCESMFTNRDEMMTHVESHLPVPAKKKESTQDTGDIADSVPAPKNPFTPGPCPLRPCPASSEDHGWIKSPVSNLEGYAEASSYNSQSCVQEKRYRD